MPATTILKNDVVTVLYHPEGGIVHHEFHKPAGGQPFRDALNAGVEAFKKYQATKWLSDDRQNGALPPEDSDWAIKDWNPRVLAAGWKYWAIVMPRKAIGQMNMKHFVRTYSDMGVTVQVFESPEAALKWLEGV